jgi:WD40-like Beta Propeller Repeat
MSRASGVGFLQGVLLAVIVTVPTSAAGPLPPGEVYRVSLDGSRIDLSRSAADDRYPVVSPDGRHVAFISDRGGGGNRVWVVGATGSSVRRVTSSLNTDQDLGGQFAWAPDSRRLAVAVTQVLGLDFRSLVYVTDLRGRRRAVATASTIMMDPAWSPDGRMIALDFGTYKAPSTRVVSAIGSRSWHVRGRQSAARWSARNMIAVRRGNPATIYVYDERGRMVLSLRGRSYAWSPNGNRIATVTADRVELHDLHGNLLFRRRVPGLHRNGSNGMVWPDRRYLAIGNVDPLTASVVTVDVRTGKLTTGGDSLFGALSPNRRLRAEAARARGGYAIEIVRRDGRLVRRLATVRPCRDLVESSIAWFPDGKSLAYDLRCQASTP